MKTLPLALALTATSALASAHPTTSPEVATTQTRVRVATSEHTFSNDGPSTVTALGAGLLLLHYASRRQDPAQKTKIQGD